MRERILMVGVWLFVLGSLMLTALVPVAFCMLVIAGC